MWPFCLLGLANSFTITNPKKVSKTYLGMVVAFATGMEMALDPFVINHILKGMNDFNTMENRNLNRTTKGPIWMVQIWSTSYYIGIFY